MTCAPARRGRAFRGQKPLCSQGKESKTPSENQCPYTYNTSATRRESGRFLNRGGRTSRIARTARIILQPPAIASSVTTVRRRPDRSRPPQVGATAHTCTDAAVRTSPAEPSGFPPFPRAILTPHNEPRPVPALPFALQSRGFGGNHSPRRGPGAAPLCLSRLSRLSSTFPAFSLRGGLRPGLDRNGSSGTVISFRPHP